MKNNLSESDYRLKIKDLQIFDEGNNYINVFRYYFAYFKTIPNQKCIEEIDAKALRNFIITKMSEDVIVDNYSQDYNFDKKMNDYYDHFIILKNNIVINIFREEVSLLFNPDLEEVAQELQNIFLQFKLNPNKERTKEIGLISSTPYGLDISLLKLKKPKLNIDLHYNDDFKLIHQNILRNIRKPKTQGLYLFHGIPGSGKSTYIKYLIHQQNKTVIFLPPSIVQKI